MKSLKISINICIQNLRKWQKDCRIYVIAAILFILVFDNTQTLKELSQMLQVRASIWLFPFLYTQFHQKLIFTVPLLLLFNNAPFIDGNSMYMISRCKKIEWHTGQFMYIIISSIIYYLYIFLCTVITILPYAELSWDWGISLRTMSASDMPEQTGHHFLNISKFIITYFTPSQAVIFTFLLSVLMAIMIGMIIYFFNIITNTKYIGCTISSIIIIFSCFTEGMYGSVKMRWFSPVTWITVDKLDVGGMTKNPTVLYCMTIYISLSLIIGIIILLLRKKLKLDIS